MKFGIRLIAFMIPVTDFFTLVKPVTDPVTDFYLLTLWIMSPVGRTYQCLATTKQTHCTKSNMSFNAS